MNFIYRYNSEKIRLDLFLLTQVAELSRTAIQKMIENGNVKINGRVCLSSNKILKDADDIELNIPVFEKKIRKSDYNIEIVFSHQDFIIINKQAGILSHAAYVKDTSENIADWFLDSGLFKDNLREESIRVGIVHRLDKETSGLMILARTYKAQEEISQLFANRKIHKTYIAFVEGLVPQKKTITYNIIRNPLNPTQMTHSLSQGRSAVTEIECLAKNENMNISKVLCSPLTGRTHQIRVHMAAIGHPLIGDKVYGKESKLINRHALHAFKIEFQWHEELFSFKKELPTDMNILQESMNY